VRYDLPGARSQARVSEVSTLLAGTDQRPTAGYDPAMGLLRKVSASHQPSGPAAPPTAAENLQHLITTAGQASLFAHTDVVKKVDCSRCGAPKRLPSKTAYLYCDHCGSLIDYDFGWPEPRYA
jgi:hypothetical protein